MRRRAYDVIVGYPAACVTTQPQSDDSPRMLPCCKGQLFKQELMGTVPLLICSEETPPSWSEPALPLPCSFITPFPVCLRPNERFPALIFVVLLDRILYSFFATLN